MTGRVLICAALCLSQASAAWGDALDDDLQAAKALLAADKVEEAWGRLEALEAAARRAVTTNPRDAHAQYILGMTAMYEGRDDVAKTALDAAMGMAPASATYVMGRAQFALYTEAPGDAVQVLQRALPENEKNPEYLEMLGHAQQALGKFVAAQEIFEKAATANPKEARYRAEVAECLVSQHREDEALAMYQKALDVNPKYSLALTNMGKIQEGRKAWDKALEAYGKAAALNPDDYRAAAKLVELNEAAGNRKARDAAREKVLALYKAGKVDAASFCREQFADGATNVMVFESFELRGVMAVRYAFNVVNADGKTVEKRISLGSYPAITEKARAEGKIKEGERMWHLDAYTTSAHETLGMFAKELTYEETRAMVKDYLAGKLKALAVEPMGPATMQGGR
jgi:tetratricopeptide (TPR) repeat protein